MDNESPSLQRLAFAQPFDRTLELLDEETPSFLGVPVARSPAELRGAGAVILGLPYRLAEFPSGAELAPRHLRVAAAKFRGGFLPELDLDPLQALRVVDYGDVAIDQNDVEASNASAQRAVRDIVEAGAIPITVGGNAPVASFACLAGIAAATAGAVGVVNLDEHSDNREEFRGSRMNAFTWVARALEIPNVAPANWAQVGMRGPGNVREQLAWFREKRVHLYTAREHRELGTEALLKSALDAAASGTRALWLGVDWDVLDTSAVPGWAYPDPLGLSAADLLRFSFELGRAEPPLAGYAMMGLPSQSLPGLWLACWSILYALAGVCARRGIVG